MTPVTLPRQRRAHRGAIALLVAIGLVLPLGLALAPAANAVEPAGVADLRADNAVTPFGIGESGPRFSWKLTSTERGVAQDSYQVRVAGSADALPDAPLWDSGTVESDQSTFVEYAGPALESQTRYFWQVRVAGTPGVESEWSEATWFETGLLDADEWKAEWIGGPGAASRIDDWTDYRVSVDFTLAKGTAFGVFLRASDASNALMWQLNDETPGVPKLRPHTRVAGGYGLLGEVDLRAAGLEADVFARPATIEIEARGATIETRVNDVLVDSRPVEIPRFSKGFVGFRTSQSSTARESVLIHSVDVDTADGTTLLETVFDAAQNPFTGGSLVPDGLELVGNHEVLVAFRDRQPLLRTEFDTERSPIVAARIYATARGVYELSVNGAKVGDQHLAPGWTDYDARIEYQTYDVTDMVRTGQNVFGAMIAPGWYAGRLAHIGAKNYGTDASLLAQLRIDYADGTHDLIATGDSWKTAAGPYEMADLIDGENYLAAFEHAGWRDVGYDDQDWVEARKTADPTATLVAQSAPPVRTIEERPAQERTEPAPGAFVYDLGQNMVGVVRVTLRGEAGATVRLRFGEERNPDGTLYTANLRSARATDYYTFDETGEITYEPRFTYHGFRYVEITGAATPPTAAEVTGLVWGSDLEHIGEFHTSNDLINRLQSNITWGQRGNFLSIPTDTPARDERMGWSGDINVFAPTASFNMDSLAFLSKWLVDLQDAQHANGDYSGVAPYHPNLGCCGGGTGWSDAGITVPWTLWRSYGDTRPIRDGWASMTAYMDFLARTYPTHVRDSSYADWLHLDDATPGDVLGTAYYAYVAGLMSEMANATGRTDEAARYAALAEDVAAVFHDRFIADDGTISGDSQAGYAIAIGMGLVPDADMQAVSARFVATLARRDFHLSTGFLGTPWLVSSLAESGNLDVAYRVLLNETYPSWGYEISKGATTIWERWNSIMPDGSFGDVSMNSFNHYAYGAVGDWMYRSIGGIAPTSAGYKHAEIAPTPGGGLTHATTSFDSVYGTYRSEWHATGDMFTLAVTVPANATATVVLPAGHALAVAESGVPLDEAEGVGDVVVDKDTLRVDVESGSYSFVVDESSVAVGELVKEIDRAADAVEAAHSAGTISARAQALTLTAFADAREAAVSAISSLSAGQLAAPALARILTALDQLTEMLSAIHEADAARSETHSVLMTTGITTSRVLKVSTISAPALPATPGSPIALAVTVRNDATTTVSDIDTKVSVTDRWSVAPPRRLHDALAAGAVVEDEFQVTSPGNSAPAEVGTIETTSRFTLGTHRLLIASSVDVALSSPVVLGSPSTPVDGVRPGGLLEISVPVSNIGAVPISLHLEAELPEGWNAPVRSEPTTLVAGETVQLRIRTLVPESVTMGEFVVPVAAVSDKVVLATAQARPIITLAPVQFDAVDLGDPASEAAHHLTAHPNSGVSVEAGLTRRYSHGGVPGSWFEFDVRVPAGKPFAVRLVDTFGSAGTKDYTVSANGAVVLERRHTAEPGTAEAWFEVDDPAISESGTVRLRFQRGDDALGDPSIANVWIYDTSVTDHVDLGFSYSEDQHELTAAPSSATSVEAGYTRRYSGASTPGSWFEFDVDVRKDSPFLLIVQETYDGPQTKEYSVFADGKLVQERALPRPAVGAGTMQYQVLIDDPDVAADGTVRVRFQKSQSGQERHDPSVADVWALTPSASTRDSARPEVKLVSPATAGPLAKLQLHVDATDNVGLAKIVANVYKDGKLVKSTQSPGYGQASRSHTATVSLPDGAYTVKYNAHDLAGNVSKTSSFAFTIDRTPPVATVKDGASFTVKTGSSYDLISFKLTDPGKIDRVELNGTVKDLTNNAWSDVNFVKPGTFGGVKGANTLVVFDVAGNTATFTFTLN